MATDQKKEEHASSVFSIADNDGIESSGPLEYGKEEEESDDALPFVVTDTYLDPNDPNSIQEVSYDGAALFFDQVKTMAEASKVLGFDIENKPLHEIGLLNQVSVCVEHAMLLSLFV